MIRCKLTHIKLLCFSLVALLFAGCFPQSSDNQIRFYRINAQAQQTKLSLIKGASEPGCHNLFTSSDVHRVAVLGYDYCEVYAEKDCSAESILEASWSAKSIKEEKREPQTKLTLGTRWVLDELNNTEVSSWNCAL